MVKSTSSNCDSSDTERISITRGRLKRFVPAELLLSRSELILISLSTLFVGAFWTPILLAVPH